jgi:hypothetical protein
VCGVLLVRAGLHLLVKLLGLCLERLRVLEPSKQLVMIISSDILMCMSRLLLLKNFGGWICWYRWLSPQGNIRTQKGRFRFWLT